MQGLLTARIEYFINIVFYCYFYKVVEISVYLPGQQ